MRENLMSGSMWQGMKTRQGDGTEALSEEMESNGSATPKSRRHPLTLPPDKWESARFSGLFLAFGFFAPARCLPSAHLQVTPAVRQPRAKAKLSLNHKFHFMFYSEKQISFT